MATNQSVFISQFDTVITRINKTFETLLDMLISRRDDLLKKISEMKQEYENKELSRKAAKVEIEKTQEYLQELGLKVNFNKSLHLQASQLYQQGLENLNTPTKVSSPIFKCNTLENLQMAITEFGEIAEWEEPDYSLKIQPIITTGKKGKGLKDTSNAAGLAIDEANERVYISDCGNSRVQVVSFKGDFLARFGQGILKEPWGVAVTEEDIFITDKSHNAVFQFSKKILKLRNRTKSEELDDPNGIAVDTNGDIFVADSLNHRMSIFSDSLQFKCNIGVGQLYLPQDVKLTFDCIVVLDWSPNCIHFFSRCGNHLSSCVTRGEGQDCMLSCPWFFCMDLVENIFISDTNNSVIVLSACGQPIHILGRKGNMNGEFISPSGISVSKSGIIFVVSDNQNHSLQCF